MDSSGADNTHMTRTESSIAIEELNARLIETIGKVKDPKVKEILCELTKEVEQLEWDSSKKDGEIETPKEEIHNLKNRVSKNERYLSRESLIIMNPPITQQGNRKVDTLAFLLEEVLVRVVYKRAFDAKRRGRASKKQKIKKFILEYLYWYQNLIL